MFLGSFIWNLVEILAELRINLEFSVVFNVLVLWCGRTRSKARLLEKMGQQLTHHACACRGERWLLQIISKPDNYQDAHLNQQLGGVRLARIHVFCTDTHFMTFLLLRYFFSLYTSPKKFTNNIILKI